MPKKSVTSSHTSSSCAGRLLTSANAAMVAPPAFRLLPPGVSDEEIEELFIESNASGECAVSLLQNLLHGRILMPEVEMRKMSLPQSLQPPGVDAEMAKLNNRLQRVSQTLNKKRARLH